MLVAILFVSICFPIIISVGAIKLFLYRVILLVMFFPLIIKYMNIEGNIVDKILFVICGWVGVSFFVNHGMLAIEPYGIFLIETITPYLIARVAIRNVKDYYKFFSFIFYLILFLFPILIIENISSKPMIIEILSKVTRTIPNIPHEMRWGLDRAQGPFDHPILLGVFCFSFLSGCFLVIGYEKGRLYGFVCMSIAFLAGFTSLSSGPLAGAAAQIGLIFWAAVFRNYKYKFTLLFALIFVAYVAVAVTAKSPPITVAFRYLTFNPHNAWSRINIWTYGSENMFQNPVFGLGLHNWIRPSWMGDSVDMFWLLQGMRHGFPVFFLSLFIVIYATTAAIRLKTSSKRIDAYRNAYVFALIGLFISGWSVHFWNATYVTFIFMLGSGIWLLTKNKASLEPGVRIGHGDANVLEGANQRTGKSAEGERVRLPYNRNGRKLHND